MQNVVYNKDCLQAMREMPDKAYDLAIVDPPYGLNMGNREGATKNGKHLCGYSEDTRFKKSDWDKETPSQLYFNELFRVSKNQIVWGGNYFADKLPVNRGWIFWDKKPIVPNYSDGELAWTSFDKVLKRVVIPWNGKIRTGIEPGYKSIHASQKPIKLYKFVLTNYAKPGDKILDTHIGSGSIRIACDQLGFSLTGFEIDKDYFEAQEERFKRHKSQLTLFT